MKNKIKNKMAFTAVGKAKKLNTEKASIKKVYPFFLISNLTLIYRFNNMKRRISTIRKPIVKAKLAACILKILIVNTMIITFTAVPVIVVVKRYLFFFKDVKVDPKKLLIDDISVAIKARGITFMASAYESSTIYGNTIFNIGINKLIPNTMNLIYSLIDTEKKSSLFFYYHFS